MFVYSQPIKSKDVYNEYVCFQRGNALCPNDHNYQIFYESQQLENYLLNNINNHDTTFTIFVANTKQDIVFLNCSLMPSNLNISGYIDSYAYIDFKYGYNSDGSKREQSVNVENLKVKSVRSETKKDQNKLKAMFLNLNNVNFINEEPLKIDAKEIQVTFNSLRNVAGIEGDKIVKLSGLPRNGNNEDLNLTVSIETDNVFLESFNDNASIDFLSTKKSDDLGAFLQFKSYKNSLITITSEEYNIILNYETYLSFYYDHSDPSSLVNLLHDSTKVNIDVQSPNAHVLFSDDQWPSSKIIKDHHDDDNSIDFDLTCTSSVTIQSSAQYVPLTIGSCKNPHLIFNGLSSSISSLKLVNGGNAIIENLKDQGEVTFTDHITFSPGAHLQILESVSKVHASHVKSEFKTLPTQMVVSGHLEIDSGEFEFLEYSVSFEYPPVDYFVVPAHKSLLMPINIKNPSENSKINVCLSDDFLTGKYNDNLKTEMVDKNVNLFVDNNVNDFTLYFRPNKHSKHNHDHYEWNEAQKGLVSLIQNGQYVSLKLTDLPSHYSSSICLYAESDSQGDKLCEKENLMSIKVTKMAARSTLSKKTRTTQYYAIISDMTKISSDVTIFLSSSDITLNLDNLESANVQPISSDKSSSVIIDNKNRQKPLHSLTLANVEVSFRDKRLHYSELTLASGVKVDDIETLSFKDVKYINADVSILDQIAKKNDNENNNFIIFGNILQSVRFIEDAFIFLVVNDNEFEVEADDYNTDDYPFIFNMSNITLIKECDKPSPLNFSIDYTDFEKDDKFIIVDKSFNDDNRPLDILFDSKAVRFLTYSTVIPFKFSARTKVIQIALGQYSEVRAVDFSAPINIDDEAVLTVSPVNDETDSLIDQNSIQIIYDDITLNHNSRLVSDSKSFVFQRLTVKKDSTAQLEGVTANGELYVEGSKTFVSIVKNKNPSNFRYCNLNVKIEEDLIDLTRQNNSPLFNFDYESIENSINSIKVKFLNYNNSLLSSEKVATIKLLDLVSVVNSDRSIDCSFLASRVSFEPQYMTLSSNSNEVVKFNAVCSSDNDIEVHAEVTGSIVESSTYSSSSSSIITSQPPTESSSSSSISSSTATSSPITTTSSPITTTSSPSTTASSPSTTASSPSTTISPTSSFDDDFNDGINKSSKKKKTRMIALICASCSAVIIVAVVVSVALYLKKHYKKGDSDKEQMMAQLNPNGAERDVII